MSTESSRREMLPVHGFVLAGGKSSRMGRDKTLLAFRGRPMVEIAVEKLRGFCAQVSIAGNRDDLAAFAPVVREERVDCGPAAGIEAGLKACEQPWAMFVPVDVPLVPEELLRRWAEEALRADVGVSYLGIVQKQPAFCLMRREGLRAFSRLLDGGERRLEVLLKGAGEADGERCRMYDEGALYGPPGSSLRPSDEELRQWFANVNTTEELEQAERSAGVSGGEADPLAD